MTYSQIKLCEYERRFIYPLICSQLLLFFGVFIFIHDGAQMLSISLPEWFAYAREALRWIEFALLLAFNILLLYVIAKFARQLKLTKQRTMAYRNIIFVTIYFVMSTLGSVFFVENKTFVDIFALPTLIMQLIWITLNLVLIYSCYIHICPAGDEDMPRRKTNIKFIDKLFDQADRRAEKAEIENAKYRGERKKNIQNGKRRK